jgi:hypothetical protein
MMAQRFRFQKLIQILDLFSKKIGRYNFFNWIAKATTDILDQGTKAGGFFFSPQVLENHWFCTCFQQSLSGSGKETSKAR